MKKEEERNLLLEVEKIFEREEKLIKLEASGKALFVGDTHGDFEATKIIFEKFSPEEIKFVFLGDYVDRGPASRENITYLLLQKLKNPEKIFLLMGNHEGRKILRFSPADFWDSLDPELEELYGRVLSKLPLVATAPNGIIALHGALPDVPNLEEINNIAPGSEQWQQVTWGDWRESPGFSLGIDPFTGRPRFGRDYFEEIMRRFGKNVLIRSHQPDAAGTMFDDRCLTLFTSIAYYFIAPVRTIAIADLGKEVRTVADLQIIQI